MKNRHLAQGRKINLVQNRRINLVQSEKIDLLKVKIWPGLIMEMSFF